MSGWSGRKVRRLVILTLQVKGTVCHLCGLPGADSADHDPPRSVLIAQGVLNPDQLCYLFPAHLRPCNNCRLARPITDDLRAELRGKRLAALGMSAAPATLSPRFARARPVFPPTPQTGRPEPPFSPRDRSEKTGGQQ